MPSWAISIDSIATVFCVAFSDGPVYFTGRPRRKYQMLFGTWQVVEQHDHAVAALALAFREAVVPVPQRRAGADALLERDVRPGDARRELEHRAVVAAFLVLLGLQRHLEPGALGEAAERDVEDGRQRERAEQAQRAAGVEQADDEIVVQHRIAAQRGRTQQ